MTQFAAKRMTGRCATGAERDGGSRYHAVEAVTNPWAPALCGATPGQRGNGWSVYLGDVVTCPRCIKKIDALRERNSKLMETVS